ncbi:MAG TPA: GNAT family N-acetyltransferase [Anaerolineae bacterium]|nr:GNAT family N-acetyltransferase [Anaerolineae bacterium]
MDTISLRQATSVDGDFLYQLIKTTMREYVEPIWGWDEDWQSNYFRERFDPDEVQIVVLDGQDIGAVSVEIRATELFLSRIYLLPAYQGRGIGTCLIQSILDEAFAQGLPVTLQVLKGNPARGLYERLGFTHTEETETHDRMVAMPR